jgi:hypothetical protein
LTRREEHHVSIHPGGAERRGGIIDVRGVPTRVALVKVGLDDDAKPWRVEEPGKPYDSWLVGDADLMAVGSHYGEDEP